MPGLGVGRRRRLLLLLLLLFILLQGGCLRRSLPGRWRCVLAHNRLLLLLGRVWRPRAAALRGRQRRLLAALLPPWRRWLLRAFLLQRLLLLVPLPWRACLLTLLQRWLRSRLALLATPLPLLLWLLRIAGLPSGLAGSWLPHLRGTALLLLLLPRLLPVRL